GTRNSARPNSAERVVVAATSMPRPASMWIAELLIILPPDMLMVLCAVIICRKPCHRRRALTSACGAQSDRCDRSSPAASSGDCRLRLATRAQEHRDDDEGSRKQEQRQ